MFYSFEYRSTLTDNDDPWKQSANYPGFVLGKDAAQRLVKVLDRASNQIREYRAVKYTPPTDYINILSKAQKYLACLSREENAVLLNTKHVESNKVLDLFLATSPSGKGLYPLYGILYMIIGLTPYRLKVLCQVLDFLRYDE